MSDLRWKLIDAAEYGQLAIVKDLVSDGADIREWEDCAVRWAAKKGRLEVVKYLVSKGANTRARNGEALRWAEANGHTGVVDYLKSLITTEEKQND